MQIRSMFLLLVWVASPLLSTAHALYLSVTQIDWNGERLEFVYKIFKDDLDTAIRVFSDGYIPGKTPDDLLKNNRPIVEYYIQKKCRIKSGDKELSIKLQSYTIEGDAFYLSFITRETPPSDKIEITSTLLQEIFPTQENIIESVTCPNTAFLRLSAETPSGAVTICH